MALSPATKEEIIRLLQEGKLSKRAIHRKMKVSRVTIDKIENSLLFPQKKKKAPPPIPKRTETIVITSCSQCGARLVKDTPCLQCSINKPKKPTPKLDWLDELLSLGG